MLYPIRELRTSIAGGALLLVLLGGFAGLCTGCGEDDLSVGGNIPPPLIPTETPDEGENGDDEDDL